MELRYTQRARRRVGRGRACALVLAAACAAGGCTVQRVDNNTLSGDGQWAAYTSSHAAFVGVPMLFMPWCASKEEIVWEPTAAPNRKRAITTVKWSGTVLWMPGARDYVRELRFSPDSRQLAARTEAMETLAGPRVGKLLLIDVASGSHRVLHECNDRVEAMAWLSDRELAWCTAPVLHEGVLRVLRCDIRAVGAKPVEVLAEPMSRDSHPEPFWSPDGRYLILGCRPQPRPMLVEIRTGRVQRFGPEKDLWSMHAEWKFDSSGALCAVTIEDAPAVYERRGFSSVLVKQAEYHHEFYRISAADGSIKPLAWPTTGKAPSLKSALELLRELSPEGCSDSGTPYLILYPSRLSEKRGHSTFWVDRGGAAG